MLKKIKNIFGFGSEIENNSESISVEERKVNVIFDKDLIIELKNEHDLLLVEWNKILKSGKNKDFLIVRKLIPPFKKLLKVHLSKEEYFLYSYLLRQLHTRTFIKTKRKEMLFFKNEMFCFLNSYGRLDSVFIEDDFLKELIKMNELVLKRFEIEERQVFPLYID